MGRNLNTQIQISQPHLFKKVFFFCNTSIGMDNYNWQFLIFAGLKWCFTMVEKEDVKIMVKIYRHNIFHVDISWQRNDRQIFHDTC